MSPARKDIWKVILDSGRCVFTTREMAALTSSDISSTVQILRRIESAGIVKRALRGVWAVDGDARFSQFSLVPFLDAGRQDYVSFLTAMHIHGMISQIPQVVMVATTSHGRRVATPFCTFLTHQIEPGFFDGFEWSEKRDFLIATPEKALLDCLYIASRRGRRYAHFPEIEFPKRFSKGRARGWLGRIKDAKLRTSVAEKLERLMTLKRKGAE